MLSGAWMGIVLAVERMSEVTEVDENGGSLRDGSSNGKSSKDRCRVA